MYERAKYFSSKFIHNGIGGLAVSAFLIYYAFTENESLKPIGYILPFVALVWLSFGLWINKKLKAKDPTNESSEITDEKISFKQVEFILLALLMAVIFLGVKLWRHADYLAIPVMIAYIWWLYSQMKLLNNYFKS
jgi:hypothetical protein